MAKAHLVRPVEVGQVIKLKDRESGEEKEYVVKEPCEHKGDGCWYCATHQETFPNQLQKDCHISNGGSHEMAWLCMHHGVEKP